MNKKITALLLAAVLTAAALSGCSQLPASSAGNESTDTPSSVTEESKAPAGKTGTDIYSRYPEAHILRLDGSKASLDGQDLPEYDYVRKIDPSFEGEQFTGTEPEAGLAAYIAHDIIYYPEIPAEAFSKENYDGEQEWVTHYTADSMKDFFFGTLPVLGNELPSAMMHSADEAYANPVIHICEPGSYIIEGEFSGQLWFDFGDEDETFADPEAKATVILNGAKVSCSAAPAIVFHNVYECDNSWEERTAYTNETDLSDAGAHVILADGSENSFTGANVYRLLKPEYKKNSTSVQKKLWKMDGAFYSFRSLLIEGEEKGTGILNISSTTFEGLDSELHLSVNSGYLNIYSQDDGINVNEDDVSVFTLNGGHLNIFASLGSEGDVIDSNGFIRINGGFLAGTSKSPSDELLDAEKGVEISDDAVILYGGSMSEGSGFGPGGRPGDFDPREGNDPPQRPEDFPGDFPGGFGPGQNSGRPGEQIPGDIPGGFQPGTPGASPDSTTLPTNDFI